MKVKHHLGFGHKDQVEDDLQALGLKYKTTPTLRDGYLITLDVTEDHPAWPALAEIVQRVHPFDGWDTFFDLEEILAAEWARFMNFYEQGHPQPDEAWEPIVYDAYCHRCGGGYRQIAPMRLPREPRMGKHHFYSLWGTPELFCIPSVFDTLAAEGVQGYEVWDAIIHHTNAPSQNVRQLYIPHVAGSGIAEEDKAEPYVCPECGLTKYAYHKRGVMRIRRDALRSDVDFQLTGEWFGSGSRLAFRETLVSRRVARLIIENRWLGARLKPVELY